MKENNCGIIFTCSGSNCKYFEKRRRVSNPCKDCASSERGHCKDNLMYDYCQLFTDWEDSKTDCKHLYCRQCKSLAAQIERINDFKHVALYNSPDKKEK